MIVFKVDKIQDDNITVQRADPLISLPLLHRALSGHTILRLSIYIADADDNVSVIIGDPCSLQADIGRNSIYKQTVVEDIRAMLPGEFHQILLIDNRHKTGLVILIDQVSGILHALPEEIGPVLLCRLLALAGP